MTYIYVGAIAVACFILLGTIILIVLNRKRNNVVKEHESISLTNTGCNGKEVLIRSLMKGNVTFPKQEEFRKLEELDGRRCNNNNDYQGRRHNKIGDLNLHKDVVPFDNNRVILKSCVEGSDYINASMVSKATEERYDSLDLLSYRPFSKINFIVAQRPKINTLPHHFQMLHENLVDVIVAFNDKEDKTLGIAGKKKIFGNMAVTLHKKLRIHPNVIKSEVELFNRTSDIKYTHKTILLDFNAWPIRETSGEFSTEGMKNFLECLCLTRKELDRSRNNLTIVLHDADGGIGASAIFVGLYSLLQQIDEVLPIDEENSPRENKKLGALDVFKTVDDLRKQRSKMVKSYTYYKLLFELLQYYCQYKAAFDMLLPENVILDSSEPSTNRTNPAKGSAKTNLDEELDEYVLPLSCNRISSEYVLQPDSSDHAYIMSESTYQNV